MDLGELEKVVRVVPELVPLPAPAPSPAPAREEPVPA